MKGNQEHLEEDIIGAFAALDAASPPERVNQGIDVFETNDSKHGRKEYRCCETMPVPKTLRNLAEWKDLTSICRVARIYEEKGESKSEVRYFISSLSAGAKRLAEAVRGHWGVENGLHWVLDMAFDDDRNRTGTGDAPENLATLRRWVLSLLRQDKSRKGGLNPSGCRWAGMKATWKKSSTWTEFFWDLDAYTLAIPKSASWWI